MVAINNSLNNKFKIVDSKLSNDKTDELFAELFALMNSNIMTKDGLTNNEQGALTNIISKKALINQDSNRIDNQVIAIDTEEDSLNIETITNNEVELARTLVETFYKDLGIESKNNVLSKKINDFPNESIKPLNQVEFLKSLKLETQDTKKNSIENDDSSKLQNLEIVITKKRITKEDFNKKEKLTLNFKETQMGIQKDSEKISTDFKIDSKNTLSDKLTKNIIEKKSKKKNKQLKIISPDLENDKSQIIKQKQGIDLNVSKNIRTHNVGDNKISLKKDVKNNESKFLESKQSQTNIGSREFLDLLESTWGEKFSKIIKNSIKNNLNKVEIELKPKNLGKLNLEISIKNNKTTINLSSESQEVVNLLNENMSKFSELTEKENKAFASLMSNNNQNDSFNKKNNKSDFSLEGIAKKKKTKTNRRKKN